MSFFYWLLRLVREWRFEIKQEYVSGSVVDYHKKRENYEDSFRLQQ